MQLRINLSELSFDIFYSMKINLKCIVIKSQYTYKEKILSCFDNLIYTVKYFLFVLFSRLLEVIVH